MRYACVGVLPRHQLGRAPPPVRGRRLVGLGFFCNDNNDEEALMRHRMLQLYVVVLALTFFVSAPALAARTHKSAEAKTHKGKVVEAGGGKLTMTDMTGKSQHEHDVPADATILCGGKKCGLEDLKAGSTITVTMEKKDDQMVVTKIRERMPKKAAK